MADGKLIETISKQAYEDLQKYIQMLMQGLDVTVQWEKELNKVGIPSQVQSSYKTVATEIKKIDGAQSDYNKTMQAYGRIQSQTLRATTQVGKETEKLRQLRNKTNRETRLQVKLESQLFGEYERLDAALQKVERRMRDLQVRKELNNDLSEKEEKILARLTNIQQKYRNVLEKTDQKMGRYSRNVGNYKSAYDGLGWSIAQLTREAPAFAHSITTGFMAISNNIPMLVDEINKLRTANASLAAEGKPTVSILKRLGGAFFSWQTIISAGITLLTIYGGKLIDMAFGLSESEKALKEEREEREKNTKSIEDNIRAREMALGKVSSFVFDQNTIDNLNAGLESFSEVESAQLVLTEIAERFRDANIEGVDALTDQDLMQSHRIQIAKNLLRIEELKIALEKERIRLDKAKEEANKIEEKYEKGLLTLKQKNNMLVNLGSLGLSNIVDIQREINELQTTNNTLAKNKLEITNKDKEQEDDKLESVKGSIAYYQEQISKLEELRNKTATNKKQWDAITEQIYRAKDALEGLKRELSNDFNLNNGILSGITDFNPNDEEEAALFDKEKKNLELKIKAHKDYLSQKIKLYQDFYNSLENLAFSVIDAIYEAENRQLDERAQKLEQQKNIEIQFAGDSAEARAAVEARYAEKLAEIEEKKAENQREAFLLKQAAAFAEVVIETFRSVAAIKAQAAILAANPITAALAPLALSQIPFVIGSGAAAGAAIIAQSIPQFKEGVRGFEGGLAVVGDGGKNEPITDRQGRLLGVSPDRPTLVDLPSGANVYKDYEDFNKELNATLGLNDINPFGASVYPRINKRSGNSGIDTKALEKAFGNAIKSRPSTVVTMDKNGFRTFVRSQYGQSEMLNNRTSFKGMDV